MNHSIEYPVIVFLGPPGSGKGTLAQKLAQHLSFLHLSTGDLLRTYAKKDTLEAQELREVLKEGKLASFELFSKILVQRLKEADCQSGVILDGFPRTLEQCSFLDQLVADPLKMMFINVSLPFEVILKRLMGRRQCSQCSQVYHIDFSPPSSENTCDDCFSPLYIREDDRQEVILNRLNVFKNTSSPILEFYKNRPFWIDFSSAESPQKCFELLVDKIAEIAPEEWTHHLLTCSKETL